MNRILFFILFLSLTCAVFPQRSLDHKIVRIDSLLSLSHQAYMDVDILTSMEHALDALSISEKETIQKDVPEAIFTLPQVLSSVGDYTQSLEYISSLRKKNTRWIIRFLLRNQPHARPIIIVAGPSSIRNTCF